MPSKTNFADKFFVVGGTLGGNVASYVRRPLDDDLLRLSLAGEYCNVLAARQMGKSSLMVRTAQKLREAGIKVAIIDLTAIGSSVSASEWYFGLLSRLVRELKIEMDEQAWWQAMEAKSPVQRFSEFLRDAILEKIEEPVVIFIDEIDSTLKLDFTDDFFAAIRAAYNARSRDEAYKRLTFVLLGVARPGDLIKDRTRTPYNIGVNVDVTDFQINELNSFRDVLDEYFPKQGSEVLQWVLDWTGGQPYLTQKLCAEVANANGERISISTVDELVETIFLSDQARTETNLRAIRDRIQNSPYLMEMLGVYKRVLAGKRIAAEERSIAQNELKLTGLLRVSPQGILQVRNRIYGRIFDLNWVKNSIPASVTNRRLIAVISSVAVTALALAGFFYYRQVNQATEVQAQTYIEGFQNNPSQEVRITNLAGLFSLGGEYEDRALDLFNSLSYQEQLALFGLATPENVGDALVVVVNGVYQTVENNPDGSALLSAMAAALEKTAATGAVGLVIEINAWVDGRNAFLQGQYEVAAASLTNVLDRSEQRGNFNIEALLERAQAYVALEQYGSALTDFDKVIELDNTRAGEVNGILLREGNEALANYLQEHPGIYRNIENAVSVPTSTPVAPTAISLPTKITDEFGVTMLLVPAGDFIAGMDSASAVEECKKYSDDCLEGYFTGLGEVRTEYLDSFYIDEYEVTNALYRACVEAGKCSPPKRNNSATRATYFDNPAYDSYPVINIHKAEAMKYCEWRGARLPTAFEWEKAARGTDGRYYPWGNEFDPAYANYGGYQEDTAEVGIYPEGKSPYGLYDMLGNVDEWVEFQDDNRSIVVIGNYVWMGGSWGGIGPLTLAGGSTDGMWAYGVRCATDAPTTMPIEITIREAEMVLVPAGEFIMGDDLGGSSSNTPLNILYLENYYIDKYEVTNSLYRSCVEKDGCSEPKNTIHYGDSKYANHPVAYVDWYQANAYCEWRGVKLPSEAEWEKAARGTDGRTYPWGDYIGCNYANYALPGDPCIGRTTEVGIYESGKSPFGVYDMAGNVNEWVSSLIGFPYPYNADDGREDLTASGERGIRGGGWGVSELGEGYGGVARSASRPGKEPTYFLSNIGFRCAKDAP